MTPTKANGSYATAVRRLAEADPASHPATEFLERLGAVFDEVPALSTHRWEIMLAMESVLSADQSVSAAAGGATQLIVDLQRENHLKSQVRHRVLDEPMLTAEAVAQALGSQSVNPRQYANTKRRKSELLGLPVKNRQLFPAFQVDTSRQRVRHGIAEVNRLLDAAGDPWGVASWWFSEDAWLDGERPADAVAKPGGPERVLAAAQALLAPFG